MPPNNTTQYNEATMTFRKQWACAYEATWEGRRVIWTLIDFKHFLGQDGTPYIGCYIEEEWTWAYVSTTGTTQ